MTEIDLLASKQVYADAIVEARAELANVPPHMTEWLASRERTLRHYESMHRAAVDGLEALKLRTAA